MLTKTNVILFIFLLVAIAYLVYLLKISFVSKNTEEHFVVEEDSTYESRMYVMKVFDLVMNRKPTAEEVSKYSALKNEQDILVAVMNDFNKSTPSTKVDDEAIAAELEASAVGVEDEEDKDKVTVETEENYSDEVSEEVKRAKELVSSLQVSPSDERSAKLKEVYTEMSASLEKLRGLVM